MRVQTTNRITSALIRQQIEEDKILTEGSFDKYAVDFSITPKSTRGKLILDVGCGKKELFSREASLYGAKVVSLSPAYRLKKHRMQAQKLYKRTPELVWQGMSVCAKAQQLPFADNIFDLVLANNSVPYYLKLVNDELFALLEMVRVAKPHPNGKVMIASFVDSINKLSDSVVDWLKCLGCSIHRPVDTDRIEITKDGDYETALLRFQPILRMKLAKPYLSEIRDYNLRDVKLAVIDHVKRASKKK